MGCAPTRSLRLSRKFVGQAPTATSADLTTLPSGGSSFLGGPLVGGALFVGRPAALARNLTLLFRRHRRKSAPLLASSALISSVVNILHGGPRYSCPPPPCDVRNLNWLRPGDRCWLVGRPLGRIIRHFVASWHNLVAESGHSVVIVLGPAGIAQPMIQSNPVPGSATSPGAPLSPQLGIPPLEVAPAHHTCEPRLERFPTKKLHIRCGGCFTKRHFLL
jgi:hypothetical protein